MNSHFFSLFRIVISNLSQIRKWQLITLFLLILMGAVAEIVSLGSIIPFFAILVDPLQSSQIPLVEWVVSRLDLYFTGDIRLNITLLFVVAVIVSGLVRFMLILYIAKFNFGIGQDIGNKIYAYALYRPYSYHVSTNSSEIIGGLNKLDQLIWVIFGAINMVSSAIIALSIVIFLIWINPVLAIIVFSGLGITYGLVFFISRKKLKNNSVDLSESVDKRIQIVQEGLHGIRDVILTQTQKLFINRFHVMNHKMYQAHSSNNVIGPSPRFAVESIGMAMIAIFAYTSISSGDEVAVIFPMLGALALGAQRLMPLVQQTYQGWVQLVGNKDLLRDVTELLQYLNKNTELISVFETPNNDILFEKSVQLKNVSFRYVANGSKILNGINIEINKGAVVGFVGVTGSGKSTIVDILMGLIPPSTGEIYVDDTPLNLKNYSGWQKKISHVSQDLFLLDASFADNIAFGVEHDNIDMDRVIKSAEIAHIDSFIDGTESGYSTEVGERGVRLSGGQIQRIGIARALYKSAEILVFDEATSALDMKTEASIMRSINNIDAGITVIMIAHRTSTLVNCDWIYEINNGKIKSEGVPAHILKVDDK